ncbi:hypothetical protein CCP3SC1_170014 [Gammaproteobacteria bacterium]
MINPVMLDLANPEQALGLYLDALLRETSPTPAEVPPHQALTPTVGATLPAVARAAVPVEVASVANVAVPVPVRTRDLELRSEPVAPPTPAPTPPPPPVATPTPTAVKTPAPTKAPVQTPTQAPARAPVQAPVTATVPTIPTQPFQTLLFQVAGLTVAVPLVELNGILRYPARLSAVPGLPSWGLGVIRHRDANLMVVDSIDLFVPENLREATRSRSNPRYLIVLGGGRFGLACDAVDRVVSLKPEEVRWRGERGRRSWLAGTVKERLCALLDVPSLVRLLKAGRLEEPET